jgi:hypothetical protein
VRPVHLADLATHVVWDAIQALNHRDGYHWRLTVDIDRRPAGDGGFSDRFLRQRQGDADEGR